MQFKNRFLKLDGQILICASLAMALACRAEQAKPDVGPPAPWVAPLPFDPRVKLAPVDPSLEMRWILKDRQINAQNNETFYHEVRQVLTPTGVNNGSHIAVNYDPSYQLLTFHWVKIWRGTNAFNRLDPDKIESTQSGLDPNELLFSAEKTALLILEDVRPGDVIDYAYSVQGNNPVFAGAFTGTVAVQGVFPTERSVTRLLWPPLRRLYVQNHGTEIKYSAVRLGNFTEFTWEVRKVAAGSVEPPLPIWYQPFPWVQLSEFQKWSDVNRLALALFTNSAPLSDELKQKIAELKRLPNRERQVAAALLFVQEEVRYLGIETGTSGYKPEDPSAVLAQRFGDCKDKTLLFTTILRALKIEAWPVFVNTRMRQTVFNLHPSATVFDHVITQVNLNGQTYWLDATANYERGPLALRSWPNYGYGLVVRPGTTALAAIPPCPVLPRTTVTQYITLGKIDSDSQLKVVTVAQGPDAEALRQYYAITPREDIAHAYLNYYARFYPDISATAPLTYSDDEQQNRVEIDESYSIRNIWSRLQDETFFHCRIYPENIDAVVRSPAVSVRTMPLGLDYPVHQLFHAEINVPALSVVRPDDQTIQNPAFYFHRAATIGVGKLFLDYEYRSLSDYIQPAAVPDYARQINAAVQLLGYSVTSD